jgi:hypothetical protein
MTEEVEHSANLLVMVDVGPLNGKRDHAYEFRELNNGHLGQVEERGQWTEQVLSGASEMAFILPILSGGL